MEKYFERERKICVCCRFLFTLQPKTAFLPAAGWYDGNVLDRAGRIGRYWSSSLYDYPSRAYYLSYNPDGVYWLGEYRYFGQSVRLVVNR